MSSLGSFDKTASLKNGCSGASALALLQLIASTIIGSVGFKTDVQYSPSSPGAVLITHGRKNKNDLTGFCSKVSGLTKCKIKFTRTRILITHSKKPWLRKNKNKRVLDTTAGFQVSPHSVPLTNCTTKKATVILQTSPVDMKECSVKSSELCFGQRMSRLLLRY